MRVQGVVMACAAMDEGTGKVRGCAAVDKGAGCGTDVDEGKQWWMDGVGEVWAWMKVEGMVQAWMRAQVWHGCVLPWTRVQVRCDGAHSHG